MCIESLIPCNHLVLCHPLLLLPSVFPGIRVFSNQLVLVSHSSCPTLCDHMDHSMQASLSITNSLCIWWLKYWNFSFSMCPSNEYPGLISFRMDWFELLAVQGMQRVFSNTTVQMHQFFGILPSLWSNTHMTTGKIIALTRWTFVSKVMSLLFNMLSRLFIAFLPRSKCLLISWLQSPSAVTLEPKNIQSLAVSIVPHLFAMTRFHNLSYLNVEF